MVQTSYLIQKGLGKLLFIFCTAAKSVWQFLNANIHIQKLKGSLKRRRVMDGFPIEIFL
jgi:hypothetical protein